MTWLLIEIFVFVLAAAVFGGLIGLGLAGSGARRRVIAFERQHQGLVDQVQSYEQARRLVEARAVARAAAEAAARGDLEVRLVETEAAAAEYRARAEAAERRVHLMQSPGSSPELIEAVAPVLPQADGGAEVASLGTELEATDAARGKAESELRRIEAERDAAAAERRSAQEIESLRAQLALSERVRAKTESDLAVAHARAEAAMRTASWTAPGTPAAAAAAALAEGERPTGLPAPRNGKADDLRRIKGIGPKNEGVLNSLGIYHYQQIAALTPANVAWLDAYMKFHGRIARDDWVGQAKALIGDGASPEAGA